MLHLARGIEDHHYWVVQELDSSLVETLWRIERESDGYRLSHADDYALTSIVFDLGAFRRPEAALDALRAQLQR